MFAAPSPTTVFSIYCHLQGLRLLQIAILCISFSELLRSSRVIEIGVKISRVPESTDSPIALTNIVDELGYSEILNSFPLTSNTCRPSSYLKPYKQ